MLIQWKKEYLLGHELLDYDHQTLVNLINELYVRVENGEGDDQISITIKCLMDYVKKHFAREEAIFLESDYPDGKKHLAKHREIEKIVLGIQSQYKKTRTPSTWTRC